MANPYKAAAQKRKVAPGGGNVEDINKTDLAAKKAKTDDIEPAPAQEETPATPSTPTYENVANALRAQIDAERGSMEKKVAVNVMIKPSLKRKMEQDVRNKKFKSMSFLITSLLEEYYK